MRQLVFVFSAFACLTGTAAAKSVMIDFEGGTNVGTFTSVFGQGTWFEDGFAVEWQTDDVANGPPFVSSPQPFPSDQPPETNLSDQVAGAAPRTRSLTIYRPDGKSFALKGIGTNFTYESEIYSGFFTPFDSAGVLDTESIKPLQFPILRPTISLDGVGVDGKQTADLYSTSATNYSPGSPLVFGPSLFGPSSVDIPANALEDFSRVTSLRLTNSNDFDFGGGYDFQSAIFDGLVEFGGSPEAVSALMACNETQQSFLEDVCTVPGLGQLSIFRDYTYSFQNWTSNVSIDSIGVEVVPLPASIWMLLCGIGGIAAMARRKRRRTIAAT